MFGCAAKVIDSSMLMVESFIEDASSDTHTLEHACDKRFELHKAVIKFGWDRALKLELVGLETDFVVSIF